MANQDLKILITGTLNSAATITEINANIAQLQSKIDKLNLSIKVDQSILNTLKDFSTQMNKIADVAKNTGKVIQESFNPDGSGSRTTYYNGLKGEFSQVEIAARQAGDTVGKITQQQQQDVNKLTQSYQQLAREVTNYNAQAEKTRNTQVYQNGNNTLKVTNAPTGTTYTETTNYAKDAQDAQKLADALSQLRQKLVDLSQTGNVTSQQLANVARAINSTENLSGLDQVKQAYAQLADQAKLAQQMADGREKAALASAQAEVKANEAQQQAIQRNLDLMRQEQQQEQELQAEIQRRLQLYQQAKQVQSQNLQTSYGNNLNQSAVNSQLSAIQSAVSNPGQAGIANLQQLRNFTQEVDSGFNQIAADARTATGNTNDFANSLKMAFSQFSIWMVAASGVSQVWNSFKQGISFINDLNSALTQISIVTYQSQQQVGALGEQYNKLAQQMSVTTQDISNESVELFRQGLPADQIEARMKVITEYAKISALDTKSASEIITAAVNSMGVSAKRAADVWSLLGDATATGADEIGQAMQKVGGTAGALKIPFEEVSSWIAVISSRTRESSTTIGDSVKSILARVQSLKETGFDSVDGTSVNQVAKALATINVQLVDSNGQFRNFGTVMNEIGQKWSSLDSRQKAYIATTVAGTYQQSKFLNLMEGYTGTNGALDLYGKAMDSAGTAEKKFQLYQQGTQAQLDKLTAAWQGVWLAMFNSSAVQNVIGGLTSMANAIEVVVKNIGLLGPAIGVATAAFMLFNEKVNTAVMQKGAATISAFVPAFRNLSVSLAESGVATTVWSRVFGAAMTMAEISLTTLKTAAVSTITFLVGAAPELLIFTAIGIAIQKVTEYFQAQKEAQAQVKAQQDQLISSYSKNSATINDLANQYEKLSNAQKNGGLNPLQEEQYTEIQDKLAKLLPSVASGFDQKGHATLQSSEAIKQQISLLQQQIDLEKQQQELKTPQNITNNLSDASNLQKDADSQKQIADNVQKEIEYYTNIKADHSEVLLLMGQQAQARQKELSDELQINAILQKNADLIKNYFSGSKIDSSAITNISSVLSQLDLKGKDMGQIDTLFKAIANDINQLNSALKGNNQKGVNDIEKQLEALGVKGKLLQEVILALTTALSLNSSSAKNNANAMQSQVQSVDQLNKELSDAKGNFSATAAAIQDMAKAGQYNMAINAAETQGYSDLANELSPINQLLQDNANGKKISANEAMDLIAKEKDLAKYISIEGDQVKINADGILNWRNAKITSYNDVLKSIEMEANANATATLSNLKNYGLEIQSIKSLADAKASLAELDKVAALTNGMGDPGQPAYDAIANARAQMQSVVDAYNNIDKLTKMVTTGLTQVGTSQAQYTNANDKATQSTQNSIYVVDKYKNSLDALNATINKEETLRSQMANTSKEYQQSIQNEINLLEAENKLIQDQNAALQQGIKTGNVPQYGMISTGSSSSSGSSTGVYAYSSSPSSISGGSVQDQVWNFLKSKGLSDSAAAGIMGNLQVESTFRPGIVNGIGASGLAQWYKGRLDSLKSYAASQGKSWTDVGVQMQFMWNELQNGYMSKMGGISNFNSLSPSQAAYLFDKYFEVSGFALDGQRQADANAIYNKYAGSSGGSVSYSGSSSSSASSSAAQTAQSVDQAQQQILQNQQTIIGNDAKIADLQTQYILAPLNARVEKFKQLDLQIAQDDAVLNSQDVTSSSYNKALQDERSLLLEKGRLLKQNIGYVNQELDTNKKLTSAQRQTLQDTLIDLKNQLIQVDDAVSQNAAKNAARLAAIAQTHIDAVMSTYDAKNATTDYELAMAQGYGQTKTPGSPKYFANLTDQSNIYRQKMKDAQDEQIAINKLLKTETLDAQQKDQLMQKYRDLGVAIADYNSKLNDLNKNASDAYKNIADNVINAEKAYYQQKMQESDNYYTNEKKQIDDTYNEELKKIQDVYNAKTKALDNQTNQRSYQEQLQQYQDSAQKIQDQINKLSLDNSDQAKSQVADLQQQLKDTNQQIDDLNFQHSVDAQKQALADQQQAQTDALNKQHDDTTATLDADQKKWDDYYNNIINDQRHWDQVTQDVMSGNTKALSDELSKFASDVKNTMSDIGTSIQNNLIDQLNNAGKAMGAITGKPESSVTAPPSTKSSSGSTSSKSGSSNSSSVTTGSLQINSPTTLYKMDSSGKLTPVKTVNAGMDYNVYGVDSNGYNVGNGYYIKKGSGASYHTGVVKVNKATTLYKSVNGKLTAYKTVAAGMEYPVYGIDSNGYDIGGGLYLKTKDSNVTYEIGQVTTKKPTTLYKMVGGKLTSAGTVAAGKTYTVYGDGTSSDWDVGQGYYITKDSSIVDLKRFLSGGYTGNGEGLAYLDQKELILNQTDTKNILDVVNTVRSMIDKMPKISLPSLQSLPNFSGAGNGNTVVLSPTFQFNVTGDLNDTSYLNKVADYTVNRIMTLMKPYGIVK